MSLNELELKLLMQQATKPKAKRKSAAEYKRAQRAKAEADRMSHGAPVTAETMDSAVLDAIADILRSGDHYGVANLIVAHAASGFRFPPQAEIRIGNRLKNRSPKVLIQKPS